MRTFDKTDELWKTPAERAEARRHNLLVLQKLAIKYPDGYFGEELKKINEELETLNKGRAERWIKTSTKHSR